ncbi:MAG: hypothetical protein ACM3PW_17085, partial [Chlamydiota bacterium]
CMTRGRGPYWGLTLTDEHNKSEHEIENPETRYERRDMSPHGVLLFLAGLAIVSVLIYFMLWGFYGYLNGFKQKRAEMPSPLETAHDNANTQKVIQSFPEPRLQANEPADLNKFQAQQEQILNSYGWVDQQAGIAHIPIEQAIDILAAHGLPVREEQTPASAGQAQAKPSGGK